ncbi:hypothetical protein TNCV_1665861 [Trichonephila clavipes]|nr:hypothetical protein TNCV_1665861 [Trichonephila clavipes]
MGKTIKPRGTTFISTSQGKHTYHTVRINWDKCETCLGSRVNEKIAVLRNSEKANGSGLPPKRRHGKERARGGKGGTETPLDLCHIGEKVG